MSVSLKVSFNGDTRRFTVFRIYVTLEELRELFAGLFQDFTEDTTMKYLDDENELVSITNQAELQEAIRLVPLLKNNTICIQLNNEKPQLPLKHHTVFRKSVASLLQNTQRVDCPNLNDCSRQKVLASIRDRKTLKKEDPKAEDPKVEPKKVPNEFERILQELEAIGCTDRQRNIEVIAQILNPKF